MGLGFFYNFLRVILHRKKNASKHADCSLRFEAVGALAAPASPSGVEPASGTAAAYPLSDADATAVENAAEPATAVDVGVVVAFTSS